MLAKMLNIDLALCTNVFHAISLVVYSFSYLIIGFVVLIVLVNALIYCEVFHPSEYVITLWNFTTIMYIVILFVGLFGIPIIVALEYIEELDVSQINTDVVVTVWLYIFWSGLVFKFMILPFHYIFVQIVVHENSKSLSQNTPMKSSQTITHTAILFPQFTYLKDLKNCSNKIQRIVNINNTWLYICAAIIIRFR